MTLRSHFTHHRPTTLAEALEIVSRHSDSARVIAGGTDLVPQLRSGARRAEHLVSINGVAELAHISFDENTGLVIGAGARISEVGAHEAVRQHYPALAHACSVMATVQVRNMGTVAGNIANGSPCADTAGPLLAYGARVQLQEYDSSRELGLESFFVAAKETVAAPSEILTAIYVPSPPSRSGSAYMRLSARSKVDMAAVTVAGLLVLDPNERIDAIRIALGAVASTPLRCPDAEKVLIGQSISSTLLEKAADVSARAARPIDDVRASAAYRRVVVRVLVGRVLEECVRMAGGGAP